MIDDSPVEQAAINEFNGILAAERLNKQVRTLLCWFHVTQAWTRCGKFNWPINYRNFADC